jgi:uncharacterized protein (UPF0548 family)
MFLARRPSPDTIDRFLRDSRDLPLSYGPTGIAKLESRRKDVHEAMATIGRGTADFERARAALKAWKHFNIGWVETHPRVPSVEADTVVAVLIRHMGFWSLNGCRVLYTLGCPDEGLRFGIAHGTLTNHAEAGEEIFEVFVDPATDAVMYRIRAISWPRAALARMGHPIVRVFQERFRRHSVLAMTRATSINGDPR